MAAGKWIGGIIGWMAGGPLGALAGYLIGSFFESGLDSVNTPGNSGTFGYGSERDTMYQQQQAQGDRNSFLFALLVLASYIIKADGRAMHSEMEVVRGMLRQNFGDVAVAQGNDIMKKLFEEQQRQGWNRFKRTVNDCCLQINRQMEYSQRLQLLNFLVMIAQADGRIDPAEVVALKECTSWMGLSADEVDSMLNMGHDDLESAYKVLGVSPDATVPTRWPPSARTCAVPPRRSSRRSMPPRSASGKREECRRIEGPITININQL